MPDMPPFNSSDFLDSVAVLIAIHPLWFGGVGAVVLIAIFVRLFAVSWPSRLIIRLRWREEIAREREIDHAKRSQQLASIARISDHRPLVKRS